MIGDELEKAMALLDANSVSGSIFNQASRLEAARKDSLASMIEQAQRLNSLDAEFRKMSETLAASARSPLFASLSADMNRFKAMATAPALDPKLLESLDQMRRAQDLSIAGYEKVQTQIAGGSRMFETIDRFREKFDASAALSATFTRALDQASRSARALDSYAAGPAMASILAMHKASARSVLRLVEEARAFDTPSLARITRSFEGLGKVAMAPVLPPSISSMFAEASASAKYLESLRLPVIDSASAAAITKAWGEKGVDRQLRALGIEAGEGETPSLRLEKASRGFKGATGFWNAITLISLLFAFYQWWDSQQMEARIIGAIRDDQVQREKQFAELKALIVVALAQHAKQAEVRFICRDRVSPVRSAARHGASRHGSIFPNQVVRPVSEQGKWIQVEYYDFVPQETRVGWVLKKYFARVYAPGSSE